MPGLVFCPSGGQQVADQKRLFDMFIEQAFSVGYLQIGHRKRDPDVVSCGCQMEPPFERKEIEIERKKTAAIPLDQTYTEI